MTWVLILVLTAYEGTAVTTVEFPTQAQCEAAGDAAKDRFDGLMRGARYICVEKGKP